MRTWQSIKWLNQHAVSPVLALLLFAFCALLHALAGVRMAGEPSAHMDAKTALRMAIIDYIDSHPWVLSAYALFVVTCLFRLEFRNAPRWSVWCVLFFLGLPCLAYAYGCMCITTQFFDAS